MERVQRAEAEESQKAVRKQREERLWALVSGSFREL
jgi:hypothetical protein